MTAASAQNSAYGLGTRLWADGTISYRGHTGTLGGYKSMAYHIPSMNITIAIHANAYTDPSTLWDDLLADVYAGVKAEYANYCASNVCDKTPSRSNLLTAIRNGSAMSFSWQRNIENYLVGYRLYYAEDDNLTTWKLAANETTLTASTTSKTFNSTAEFLNVPTGTPQYFRVTAIGQGGKESAPSDIYAVGTTGTTKVLVVDGFDRCGEDGSSWSSITHSFVTNYYKSLRDAGKNFVVSSCANEALTAGAVNLNDYGLVVWTLGDESTDSETFSFAEQQLVKTYLENGGKMIVTGSEIGWDIDYKGTTSDKSFYNNYLKASYVDDGSSTYKPATGVSTISFFNGMVLNFGTTYPEDYPDNISPVNGAEKIFSYNGTNKTGGVGFVGKFGASAIEGGIVHLSFPLETTSLAQMTAFMPKAWEYLNKNTPLPNIAPVAYDDNATTSVGQAVNITVLANDTDANNNISANTVSIATQAANGTLAVASTGVITYTPNTGFSGTDNFTYNVKDATNLTSNNATVTITISATVPCTPTSASVVVDNGSAGYSMSAGWVASTSTAGYQGVGYYHDNNQNKGISVVNYSPTITGVYDVFVWFVAGSNRPTNAKYRITHDNGTTDVLINQQLATNNAKWVSLGRYTFTNQSNKVQLRTEGTDGYFVIADAAKFDYAGCPGGCIKPLTTEKIIDNANATLTGAWTVGANAGYYGTNYVHDGATGQGTKTATFTPSVEESGSYELYTWYVSGTNRATNIPIDVYHANGTTTLTLNQQTNGSVWKLLGTFDFDKNSTNRVVVRTDAANGVVIADAFRWVHKGCKVGAGGRIEEQNQRLESFEGNLVLYPNPFETELHLQIQSVAIGKTRIQIMDVLGRSVFEREYDLGIGKTDVRIESQTWTAGMYVVRIQTADGKAQVGKVLKK